MADFAQEFAASRGAPEAPVPATFDTEFSQFRQQQREEQGRFNASVLTAVETTPETVAKQKYLSSTTGVPMDVVKTAEGQVQALAKLRELHIAAQTSPVLRDRLSDPNFAALAQNDAKPLSGVEALLGSLGSGVVGQGIGGTISGISTMLDIGARAIDRPIRQAFGDDVANKFWYTPARVGGFAVDPLDALKTGGKAFKDLGKLMEPGAQDRNFATDVAQGLGQITGQIGMYLATGGAASLATLYAQGVDAMEQNVGNDKASQANKDMALMLGATVTALTEKYALDKILGPMTVPVKNAVAAAVARVGVAAAAEGGQELAENIGQDIVRKLLTNSEAQVSLGDAAYAGGVGATVGGIVRSLVEAALHVRARGQQREIEQTQREIEQLQKIMQTAAGSQVFELDKQTFGDFVQAAAERTGTTPTAVWVDGRVLADTLAQSGLTEEQIDAVLPSVRAQLAEAVTANSPVEIPIGELIAGTTGTPLEQSLLPELRLKADGLSLNEAKLEQQQAQEFLQQQAERVIQQAADNVQTAAGAETVRNIVKTELDSVGRFSSDVNDKGAKLVSQFYTVMAERLKTTPEKLYNDLLQYKVRGEGQGALDQNSPQFKQWFGDSKVVNAEGKPLVMYHVTAANFDTFDTTRRAIGGEGSWFSSTPPRGYGEDGENIMPVYLSLQNPKIIDKIRESDDVLKKQFIEQGYDGVVMMLNGKISTVVAFDPTQIKSAIGNNGQYDPNNPNILEQSMSTRLPWAKPKNKEVENPLATQLVVGLDAVARNPKLLEKFAARMDGILSLRTSRAKNPKARLENYIKQMTDNLLWLHDNMPPELRERAKLWYDGARAITERLQARYDNRYSDMQIAAVLAVMSPQMDWFTNVTLGERIIDVFDAQQDFRWTPEMTARAAEIKGFGAYADEMKQIEGKTLGELNDDFLQALWVATYDRTYHTTDYRIVTPEGDFTELDVTAKGEPSKASWANGFGPIAKAISVLKNNSVENVSAQLGGMHKVRNFYNNIFAPNAKDGSVTIDTHAVAAALLMPLSGTSAEVADNFGAAGSDSLTGVQGTFAVYAEAYRRAAAERGLLAREMQSITWEAVRGLFSPEFKRKYQKDTSAFDKIWKDYHAGKLDLNAARQDLLDFAGGITAPSWAGRDRAQSGERWSSSYAGELLAQSGVDGAGGTGARGNNASGASTLAQSAVPNKYQQKYLAGRELGSLTPEERAQYDILATPTEPANGRDQQTGNGRGRYSSGELAPLDGAPHIDGASGPDARLVAVAEQYALDHGIDLKRQSEYVKVDPERAARIAAAYEAMPHAPQDPQVKAAYENLMRQTMAQYRALEAAGYRFYFFDDSNDPYAGNPWNAMRELRANQTMGVYATEAGFGSGATNINVDDNPLLADTGIVWPYGSLNGEPKRVLANDLFRAVHDAFGHGLEGAGFRAQGEENAWQAHAKLFTGSALAALTTETRGQNSWLNFGPRGEANANAKVEDTVFADQKTGLMPEWTWTEGVVDNPDGLLNQPARGTYDIRSMTTVLNGTADLSTFLHETGHFFLDAIRRMVLSGQATPEVLAMYQGALKGLGVTEDEWNAWHDQYEQTGNIPDGMRKAHEKWAETFEVYLFTGEAPSIEMRGLFRTFMSWLKRVYASVEAFAARSGTTLDPDLKAVMGKMLATDAEIAEAEQVAGLLPNTDATAEAQEKMNARSLRDLKWAVNAKNKLIAKLQKEAASLRKTIEDEVRAEVEAMPIYRALRWIKKGELTTDAGEEIKATKGHKLNTEAIAQMYPESMLNRPDLAKLKGMTASTGLHPDLIADMIPGWTGNGDALVRALIDAEPMSSVIEGMTDQRMLERHGDLATPEAIAQAALEAVHNEARAKSLATELASQRDMLNTRRDTGETNAKGQRVTANVLMEAAKTFAANVIGRRRLKDLKKATWAHVQAERRAGKAWEAATAKGDTQGAVQAKQDQMLNNAAAKAGIEAQAQVRKALELFKKITRGTDEKLVERGYDPDIANAARAILAAYGIAPSKGKSAVEYLETLQRNDPATFNAVAPSVNGALINAKPFDQLTFDELEALVDEVSSLWHLARRSRQMEVDGNLLDREDVQEELKSDLETKGIPAEMPGDTSAITPREQALRKLLVFKSAATRVENWTQNMGAMFTKYVFQPVKEAADRYRAAKTDYLKQYRALLQTIEPTLKREEIVAHELGYTFGKDTGGVGMNEVLHAILNTGNESNKRKLLLGRGWATELEDGTLDTGRWDAFVQRMIDEGRLVKAHYDFAQGVWDLLESMKPLAQKTHRDVFGRYFAEVTADAFVTPFGTYRGGYVPAIADSRIVSDAATRKLMDEENDSMTFAFPATNRGFTKSRVEYNRPLMLDLRTLAQHIDKVLLFSHMELPVRDARRVLTAKEVAYGLNRIDPAGFDNVITPWLNRAARQQVETPVPGDAGTMRFFSAVRNRAGLAAMFANLSNAAQQLTGFSLAAVKVKPSYLLQAAAQMTASPKEMKQAVADASVYMKERMENETSNAERAIADILLKPSVYENAKNWSAKHAYFVQQAIDNLMGPVIWTGAFNQATAQGLSEKDAVRFADSVIRTTQGSTLPEDVSRIEGGNAFVRMFTQFSSYFNMQANLLGTEFAKTARELGVKKGAGRMLYIAVLGFATPAWVAEAIAQAFRGGPDDEDKDGEYLDDWLMAVFGFGTLRNMTALIPGVGQVINAGVNSFNSKPYDDRIASSPAVSMIESAVSAPHSVYKAMIDDGSRQKAVRDVATLLTLTTGLPVSAAARPVGYLAGMSDYHINPTSGADMARGLVTGAASPASK